MDKAIITGATGFIGSFFVKYLVEKNIDVLALGRKNFEHISKERQIKINGSKYLNINMSDISTLNNKVKAIGWKPTKSTVFINLAWGGVDKLSDLDVEAQMRNVPEALEALKVANLLGCKKFLQIGTMEEAFTNKYLGLDFHKNNEYNRHVVYSTAKIAAKRALMLKSIELNIDLIYVLQSHVMAPDDDKDSFLQVTLQKLIDKDELSFSSGEQIFDVISVKDCVKGYFLICQKGIAGSEYWVGSGEPRKLREYVERMYKLYPSGKKMKFGSIPYNDIKLNKKDLSIDKLVKDTGYAAEMTYEDIVTELYDYLNSKK
jgi:nucleoside-diphosphate-sugar epimerase